MTDETVIEQGEPAPVDVADATITETSAPVVPEKTKEEKALESMQARINELTWKLRERERQEAVKPEPAKVPDVPPTRSAFEYDEDKFQAAQTEYVRNEARRIAREELKNVEQERAAEQKSTTFREREKAFADKTPDYVEKVYNSGTVPISDAMAEEITDSEMGAEVAYYLANNIEVARQLYELPPRSVAREIGRIEARLAVPKAVAAPKVSQAPPPVPRVDSSSGSSVSVSPDSPESDAQWSAEEWAKRRNKQLSRKKS